MAEASPTHYIPIQSEGKLKEKKKNSSLEESGIKYRASENCSFSSLFLLHI